MDTKKVLIVGGVAGGATAAARLRRLSEHAQIILFEKGEHISFANCGLPYYIGGTIAKKSALILQTPESFEARFLVDVRIFSEVTGIDKAAKTVAVKNHKTGETYIESYDKLILAMGAEPIKPVMEGLHSTKVFTLRSLADAIRIKDYIDQHHLQTSVVVGGGYIGVEMVENLHSAGLAVTLIEMQNQVIAPLDFDMACEVHRHIESKGVRLLLGHAVRSVREANDGLQIVLDSGEIQADMLIMAIGVKPESSLAKAAGLQVTERGAIVVGDDMMTSDPSIYAIGDAIDYSAPQEP